MQETELRDWIRKKLKITEVPDPIWKEVQEDYEIELEDILKESREEEESKQQIRELVQKRLAFDRDMQKWREGSRADGMEEEDNSIEIANAEVGEYENQRAKAVVDYVANLVSCERAVYRFRRDFLGGRVITPDKANNLLSSVAAAHLPWRHFLSQGTVQVPLLEHQSAVSETASPNTMSVFVDPPGKNIAADTSSTEDLLAPSEYERPRRIPVRRYSVLGRLWAVSSTLPRSYPWQEHHFSWFVLTGIPPEAPAARGHYRASSSPAATYGTVTLEIQPWVSAKAVYGLYQQLQKQVLLEQPRKSLSERNVALFRFVMSLCEAQEPSTEGGYGSNARPEDILERTKPRKIKLVRPSWGSILERWNRDYPMGHEWHYYEDRRRLRRDFCRAERAIVYPRYRTSSGDSGDAARQQPSR